MLTKGGDLRTTWFPYLMQWVKSKTCQSWIQGCEWCQRLNFCIKKRGGTAIQ